VAVARKTILVVEDNDDLRRVFGDALKSAGFAVCEASDGPQALHCIEDAAPDVVVLDIGLPTLDGISVREELAAHPHTRHVPVIVVTGEDVDLARLRQTRVLRKPVMPSELIAAVRVALAGGLGQRLAIGRDGQPD
jgi:CheY-like chemotaxis protein